MNKNTFVTPAIAWTPEELDTYKSKMDLFFDISDKGNARIEILREKFENFSMKDAIKDREYLESRIKLVEIVFSLTHIQLINAMQEGDAFLGEKNVSNAEAFKYLCTVDWKQLLKDL